ncbi:GTPase HflX [Hyphobacterium sp. HN65]|uniref:GTPase HflX n=1 Tax=Hyphobacterium lacteum TaxID=3116575 RepID=A0ABU7LM01_9PROT|nr:GTPase HflX [Hyphobacterium sp. HN65]MEE2524950.1 GTPase HflX [Hyphobacterium sp. HN65]
MIETETPADKVLVIRARLGADDPEEIARLEEATGLAEALGLDVLDSLFAPVRKIDPGRFFGKGKLDELGAQIAALEANVVVVDAALSPVQQRNLEKAWKVKVIDRTGLILEIFGLRARTKEGRLQVELARLAYERSRLVRTWTHLERQRGGVGVMGGPGETQIEADRRILADKIAKLRRELDEVRRTRALHRKTRKAAPFPMVAIVGYTNAGKSTLFNKITGAGVFAKDMPFATLDTTIRGFITPAGTQLLLSDTVGFITDLPTELVAAFRATLEEVREADIIVHVLDVSAADFDVRRREVEAILDALDAGAEHGQPVIEVFNKIDLWKDEFDPADLADLPRKSDEALAAITVSAQTGEGIDRLLAAIDEALAKKSVVLTVKATASQHRAIAWLHEHGAVISEKVDEHGTTTARTRLSPEAAGRFSAQFPDLAPDLEDAI